MASVITHELEETVTDPNLNAWYDTLGNENADKCAWTFGTTYTVSNDSLANMKLGSRDYLIQRNWINAAGGYCDLSYGTVTKLDQTINFSTPSGSPSYTYPADSGFTVGASATSGLPVSFSVTSGPCSVSGTSVTITGASTCVVQADQSGNASTNPAPSVSHSYPVNKAVLMVTANNLSKDYSDPVPSLTAAISGFVSPDTASVVSGTPVLTTTAGQFSPAGTYPINVDVSGMSAANYTFSPVNGTLTVVQEKTAIIYNGDPYVLTSGPTVSSALVQLAANLNQQADGYPGDLSLATVRFELYKATNSTNTPDQIVANIPVSGAGLAQTSINLAVNNWVVIARIEPGNLDWQQSEVGMGAITVSSGGNSQGVTGGGWVADSQSSNGKGNFGFTVNPQKNGTPKGNSIYLFHGTDGYDYLIKSTSWQSGGLSFYLDPSKAAFNSKAVVQKIDPVTRLTISSFGNYSITVNLVDGDQLNLPQTDKYAITIFDSNNQIWRQNGTSAAPIALGGGNVSIHSK